jgi:hypothetical protein
MGRSSGCGPVQPKDQALEGSAGSLLMPGGGDFSGGPLMNGHVTDAKRRAVGSRGVLVSDCRLGLGYQG